MALRRHFPDHLLEQDGQRIGFLTAGTGRHPGTQRLAVRVFGKQAGNGGRAEKLPERGIAEKIGDPDQQFLEQQVKLLRVLTQVGNIAGNAVDLQQGSAPLDAAIQRARLVQRKVVAAAVPQQDDDLVERTLQVGLRGELLRQFGKGLPVQIVDDASRQAFRRRHDIDHAGPDRAFRHTVGLGALRLLGQGEA